MSTEVESSAHAVSSRRGVVAVGLVFLAFLSAGLVTLLNCPPLWRGYDGFIQVNFPPDDFTILQYPAAYPIYSRLHFYAVELVEGHLSRGKHHKLRIDLREHVPFDDTAVYTLLASQQFLLAAALTGFVVSLTPNPRGRAAAAMLLISDATFFLTAEMIGGEALSLILLVSLAGLGISIFRADRLSWKRLAIFAALLYAAMLARHEDAVFAGLVPLAFVISGILAKRCAREGLAVSEWRAIAWKRATLLLGVGVCCVGLAAGTTRILCRVFDVPYRPTSARRTSERLGFVDRMTADEKSAYLAGLKARTSDPLVQEMIPRVARKAGWVEQRDEVEAVLLAHSPGMEPEALHVEADHYLELVSNLFFATINPHLVLGTIDGIWKGMTSLSPAAVSRFYLWAAADTIDIFAATPFMARTARGVVCCGPTAKARLLVFRDTLWVRLWAIPNGAFLLAAVVGSTFFLFRRIGPPALAVYALSVALTGLTITSVTLVFMDLQPRFTVNIGYFSFLALAVLAASALEAAQAAKGKRAASSHL